MLLAVSTITKNSTLPAVIDISYLDMAKFFILIIGGSHYLTLSMVLYRLSLPLSVSPHPKFTPQAHVRLVNEASALIKPEENSAAGTSLIQHLILRFHVFTASSRADSHEYC